MPNKDGELECTANTSQTLSFQWKIDVGSERRMKIESSKTMFNRLQCIVHYTIRGKNCTLMSTIISKEGTQLYRFYHQIIKMEIMHFYRRNIIVLH